MAHAERHKARVASRYGAPMGRPDDGINPADPDSPRFYMRRVRLDAGGYDRGGAYWGFGESLFEIESDCGGVSMFRRAASREAMRAAIRADYPGARFFR